MDVNGESGEHDLVYILPIEWGKKSPLCVTRKWPCNFAKEFFRLKYNDRFLCQQTR